VQHSDSVLAVPPQGVDRRIDDRCGQTVDLIALASVIPHTP
jgi:hypothetical protein